MAARRAAARAQAEGYAPAAAAPAQTVYTPLTTPRPATARPLATGSPQAENPAVWESQSPLPAKGEIESITQQAVVLARSPSPQPFVMDLTDIR